MSSEENLTKTKTLKAKLTESFTIRIWEDRTRGSRWAASFDATALQLLADDFDRTRNIRVSDIGMRCFEFQPLRTGQHTLTFESRYGWKFAAENRIFYEVEVT